MIERRGPGWLGRHAIRLARLVLLWERVWLAAWPLLGLLGLGAAAALFDLPALIPSWLHLALLVGYAALLCRAAWRLVAALRLPPPETARRRLERDSGLRHRPLAALEDQIGIGAGDDMAEALWRAHLARMRRAVGRVRIGLPRPGLPGRDPAALRLLLLLVLVIALVDARGEAGPRLMRALSPELATLAPRAPAALQLWVTPPAYTGVPPIYLHAEEGTKPPGSADEAPAKPIAVPAGSRILARIQGGRGVPELLLGQARTAFTAADATTFRIEGAVEPADRIAVEQDGHTIGAWPIAIIPDAPPTIAFADQPSGTLRGALRLEYKAMDDYGVASVNAEIIRPGGRTGGGEPPLMLDLPLPNGHPREAHETSFHDLTANPWAGLPVTIRLIAADEPGQVGRSDAVEMTLPERVFNHPVAREIIEARKLYTREPTNRYRTARAIDAIAAHPERFGNDKGVFLSLITVRARLILDASPAAVAPIQQQLWETALAIEEGHLPAAERELRALQEMLRQALANNADDREIEKLMSQLESAMDKYLAELARNGDKTPPQQLESNSQPLRSDELHRMMDRARELSRSGARDAARQLLSQLQDMLENLRTARSMQGGKGQGQAGALMRKMDELIGRQSTLLDRSFRSAVQNGEGQPGERMGGDPAGDQEDVRKSLGDIMRRLGEMSGDIPKSLGKAEQSMRDAAAALKRGSAGDAVDPQGQALQGLREGRQSMMEGLRKMLGEEGDEESLDAFGPGHDPSGRAMPGFGNLGGNDVRIPDHGEVQRAREIQEELQRRAGQRQRPELELEYIERLLKRF